MSFKSVLLHVLVYAYVTTSLWWFGFFASTDIRDVYGTILTRWLNMPEGTVRSSVLPVDTGDPNERWTSPNFNLGFLA